MEDEGQGKEIQYHKKYLSLPHTALVLIYWWLERERDKPARSAVLYTYCNIGCIRKMDFISLNTVIGSFVLHHDSLEPADGERESESQNSILNPSAAATPRVVDRCRCLP